MTFIRYLGIGLGWIAVLIILFGSIWFGGKTTPLYWVVVLFTAVVLVGGLLQFRSFRMRRAMMILAATHFLLAIASGPILLHRGEDIGDLGGVVLIALFDLSAFVFQRQARRLGTGGVDGRSE